MANTDGDAPAAAAAAPAAPATAPEAAAKAAPAESSSAASASASTAAQVQERPAKDPPSSAANDNDDDDDATAGKVLVERNGHFVMVDAGELHATDASGLPQAIVVHKEDLEHKSPKSAHKPVKLDGSPPAPRRVPQRSQSARGSAMTASRPKSSRPKSSRPKSSRSRTQTSDGGSVTSLRPPADKSKPLPTITHTPNFVGPPGYTAHRFHTEESRDAYEGWYRQKLSQQAAAAKAKKEGAESSMSAEEKRRINEQCFEQWLARKRDLEAKKRSEKSEDSSSSSGGRESMRTTSRGDQDADFQAWLERKKTEEAARRREQDVLADMVKERQQLVEQREAEAKRAVKEWARRKRQEEKRMQAEQKQRRRQFAKEARRIKASLARTLVDEDERDRFDASLVRSQARQRQQASSISRQLKR